VPIHVRVADWTIPDPGDFRTFVGIYQSPTAVALTYDVPMWSERHWRLVTRSLQLLGQLGNRMVQIPVVDRTKLGNDEGMVRWVRKPDGSFDHDFSLVERYLKLVKRHVGVPKFVVLFVWHAGGWRAAGPKQKNTVTVVDKATGKREPMQVPEFGTPEAKAFWSPVLLGLKKRLADAGMGDAFCLGSVAERYPSPAVSKMFTEILGEAPWLRITHAAHGALEKPNRALAGGGRIGCHIYTYLAGLPDPAKGPPAVHKPYWPRVAYYRRAQQTHLSLIGHRLLAADSLMRRLPGFSHLCLDYWRCPKVSKHRGGMLYGHWVRSGNYPGDPEPGHLTWPGPDGAEPLTAFEALREGIQEAEAMIVISEALTDRAKQIGPALAGRCRQALVDYLAYCRSRNQFRYQYVYKHMNHYGWQELSARLFALAAEVTAKAKGGD